MPILHKELPLAVFLPENQSYKLLVQAGLSVRAVWNNCGRKVMPGTVRVEDHNHMGERNLRQEKSSCEGSSRVRM